MGTTVWRFCPEVKGFVPYPSPTGDYWAWASRNKTGIWITENTSNPVELSTKLQRRTAEDQDGQTIYFFENYRLYSASAPQFTTKLPVELPGEEILGVIK